MSRRPPRRGAPPEAGNASAPAAPVRPSSIQLPPSGLAREILAAVDATAAVNATDAADPTDAVAAGDHQPPTAKPDSPQQPDSPQVPRDQARGPTRIYSFADSLERREAAAPAAPPERPESWVTFELAGELYALPVARIQEIQRAGGITRVPHAPPPVRGIANLRGKVLVVVDLRLRLGLPPAAADERSRILVVSSRERSLGLLVDAAHQVLGLLPSRIEPPPADLMDERSAYLAGVVQIDDSLVIALDIDQLLLVPEEAQTAFQPEAGGTP